jgi:hypothetical protein
MARHDGQHRVWPWVIAIFIGLLTTAAGSAGYATLGTLVMAGAIAMIVRAVRRNRAARRAALALAAAAQAARIAKNRATQPAAGRRPGRSGGGRRTARKLLTLLP